MIYRSEKIHLTKRHYVTVVIAHTEKSMVKLMAAHCNGMTLVNKRQLPKPFVARTVLNNQKGARDIATIFFCKKWRGVGLVSHELLHVVVHYCRMYGKMPSARRDDLDDEPMCDLMETVTRNYWRTFNG